ncbi:hypothetical protein F4820DRAFT_182588 [Hypoxylon rubiginosum]|uniref:Uncharacterized protein n=1 Tax=Hypoxylon rubiginosum TaxID=110542 RepID=A0ACB9YJ23_9PEZI|nr:hypothetical protein F4820DRAFT_182588 [Hypoxylon rubiginosum]
MPTFNIPAFVAALFALGGADAYGPPVSGHDFDFSVAYRSGLTFSTTSPPTEVLAATDVAMTEPLVTLADPDGTGRDGRYVAFAEVSYVPTYDGVDDVIYTVPWLEANLTVLDNGTLTPDPHTYGASRITHFNTIYTGEVRNATVHVWRQTPELVAFLLDDDDYGGNLWLQLVLVWSNTTGKISYDFPRANVDFKVRNETGEYRGDVDENGASIVGYVSSSTSAVGTSVAALPTDAPGTTTGSSSVPASTTTGTAGPTETPNVAPSSMAASGILLLAPMILAVL